jgi:hypothetical protein
LRREPGGKAGPGPPVGVCDYGGVVRRFRLFRWILEGFTGRATEVGGGRVKLGDRSGCGCLRLVPGVGAGGAFGGLASCVQRPKASEFFFFFLVGEGIRSERKPEHGTGPRGQWAQGSARLRHGGATGTRHNKQLGPGAFRRVWLAVGALQCNVAWALATLRFA